MNYTIFLEWLAKMNDPAMVKRQIVKRKKQLTWHLKGIAHSTVVYTFNYEIRMLEERLTSLTQ